MEDRAYMVRGASLYVRESGTGEPLVLLHGGGPGTSSEGWRRVQAALSVQRTVYALDLPGFGRSAPMRDPDPAAFAELVLAALDEIGLGPTALAGHSMGAQVAARTALAGEQRFTHLILVAPGGRFFGVRGVQPGILAIERFIAEPSLATMRTVVELLNARHDDLAEEMQARFFNVMAEGRLSNLRALMRRRSASPEGSGALLERLRTLSLRTLLVWGGQERFTPVAHGTLIHAMLPPCARFAVIEAAGHTIQHDRPAELAAEISAFMKQ